MIKMYFLPHFKSFMWERKFEKKFFKKSPVQPPNGVLLIFKLSFPNGSYRNGVCIGLWAYCLRSVIARVKKFLLKTYNWISKLPASPELFFRARDLFPLKLFLIPLSEDFDISLWNSSMTSGNGKYFRLCQLDSASSSAVKQKAWNIW